MLGVFKLQWAEPDNYGSKMNIQLLCLKTPCVHII
jgi:hypothetical protein